jgi:hypothetical protein
MFLVRYAETAFGRNRGEVKSVVTRLCSTAPARFHKADWALTCLLADLSDPAFSGEMDSLVEAYRAAGAFHPDISLAIADYYGKTGEHAQRDVFLHQVADRVGYGEEGSTREACVRLGTELLRRGEREEGRRYLWMAARYAQTLDPGSQQRIVQSLKP